MSAGESDIEAWDRYWAYGYLHSCSALHAGNYRGAIAAHWRERFQALADGSRALDVATGNGALALMALETADARDVTFDITAADLAAIDPVQQAADAGQRAQLARVRFWPRTPAEALPVPEGAFDRVCSQFGLEYSDLRQSLPEIARVLAPGGRLSAVIHHADSVIVQPAYDEIAQMDHVVDRERLYLKMRNLLRALREGGRARGRRDAHPKVAKKRRAVDEALARIDAHARTVTEPERVLGPARYVRELLAAVDERPDRELEAWLEEARARIRAHRARVAEMIAVAHGPDEVAKLEARLAQAGFDGVAVAPLSQDDATVLGWCLDARRVDCVRF
jgi:ubiquinone/menaquinone biosynthesis C-methylase UbiE